LIERCHACFAAGLTCCSKDDIGLAKSGPTHQWLAGDAVTIAPVSGQIPCKQGIFQGIPLKLAVEETRGLEEVPEAQRFLAEFPARLCEVGREQIKGEAPAVSVSVRSTDRRHKLLTTSGKHGSHSSTLCR